VALSAEWVTAIATVGTFLVIAASAGAALFQLRHMRSGNQIQAYNQCRETMESVEFRSALDFIFNELPGRLHDPGLVEAVRHGLPGEMGKVRLVGNLIESMGLFVRRGLMDERIACELWSSVVLRTWNALSPLTALERCVVDPAIWENFEYMAALSRDYIASHPQAAFPPGLRRMPPDLSLIPPEVDCGRHVG
jgi:hypothetical protein